MAWTWESFEHYKEFVQPVEMNTLLKYNNVLLGSVAMRVSRLAIAAHQLEQSIETLRNQGFVANPRCDIPDEIVSRAHETCIDLIEAGETALLVHQPLAVSDNAYGFLHQHTILKHWDRYVASRRIAAEICRLVDDAAALLAGYRDLAEADNRFLATDVSLPRRLHIDFLTARDLFSIGQDEMALFAASRGLEATLRLAAKMRRLQVRHRSTSSPAAELSFHDLIEYFYRLEWRKGGERVLSKSLRGLLHYLRQVRNAGAHATSAEVPLQPRETALIIAAAANELWHKIAISKGRFRVSVIDRTWTNVDGAI